jgi:hypothetical protein
MRDWQFADQCCGTARAFWSRRDSMATLPSLPTGAGESPIDAVTKDGWPSPCT